MPPPLLPYGGGVAIPPWSKAHSSRASRLAELPLVFHLGLLDSPAVLTLIGEVTVFAMLSGRRMMRLTVFTHHGTFETVAALDSEILFTQYCSP